MINGRPIWSRGVTLFVIVALLALYSIVQYQVGLKPELTLWWSDGFWTFAALAVAGRCFMTSRRFNNTADIRAWMYFAVASFSWAIGMLIWDYFELIRGTPTPFPSLSDVGFQGLAFFFIVASLHFQTDRQSHFITIKHGLNIGILFIAVLMITVLALNRSLQETTESLSYVTIALAYPVVYGAALLFAVSWLWVAVEGQRRQVYALMVVGLMFHSGVNIVYAASLLVGDYQTGLPLDVFWLIGFGFFYFGAVEAEFSVAEIRPNETTPDLKKLSQDFDQPSEALVPGLSFLSVLVVGFFYRDAVIDSKLSIVLYALAGIFATLLIGRELWNYLHQRGINQSLIRHIMERNSAEDKLHDALESISEGFVLFDEKDQLVVCNNRYKEMYGYSDEDVRPGVHTRELGHLDILRGNVILESSVDEYLNRRDDRPTLSKKPFIIHLSNGKILETQDRVTSSGGIVSTQKDVTEFKMAQKELEKSHNELEVRVKERTQQIQKLSLAVEQSPNAVFITDLAGTIEYVNSKFTDLTGYSKEEALGQNPRILKSNETPPKLYSNLWKTIRSGREWKSEIKDRHKDGSHFWAYEIITPVKDENGVVTHYVATHEDISERKHAELAVQSALQKAEVANRAKSDLMANMSHELRTPLNAIIGFSSSMIDETFGPISNDRYLEYLNDIHHSGQHLLDLINDILDFSAIEADALEINEENINLTDVVDSSVRLVMPRAEFGKVTVSSFIDPSIPLIFVDGRRLKQVLLNLLSNAVKFTGKGGDVSISALLNEDGSLSIAVSDNGEGMDEEGVIIALSSFGQVESGLNRKHEGTGLGLPLVKRLMDLHGGTLNMKSTLGHGTTVTVTFPKERVGRDIC